MDISRQLRDDLIGRIEKIEDINFLQAIQTILDASQKELYKLSPEQLNAIEESRAQFKRGEGVEHSVVINDLTEWLKNE